MKAIRRQGGFGRFAGAAAAILRLVVLMGVGVAPPASAALPRFTSAVELKGLSGEPAGIRDPEIQRIDPVSAGYGAAGTLNGGPVRWDANGTATSLPLPDVYNGGYVYVYGANNAGQVVGTVAPGRAIRWEADGSPTMLGPPAPDGYAFFAYGINNVGQAVGVSGTPTLNSRGTRWAADGSCTVLADVPGLTTTHSAAYNISDTGIAVGYFEVPDYSRYPVRWAADGSATLLGAPPRPRGTATYAVGVNNAGEAVGYTDLGVGSRAVRWAVDGSATGLADLPGHAIDSSVALGITNGGLIGGSQFEADVNNNYVVLWDADGTPARLQDLMADGNTWRFWEFDGIDSDATTVRVLAIGSKNGGPPNYYLVEGHVPEPASLSLLALAALALRRPRPARRRNGSESVVFRKAAVATIVPAFAVIASVARPASATPPKFTSAVELLTPDGAPANAHDVETSRTHPVSAGFGAAGTYGGAVRWAADGSATPLPTPPGYGDTYVRAFGINDRGQVVGIASPGKAVRWDANGAPTLLNGAGAESYGTGANGINNLGQVVGEDYGGMPKGEVGAIRWAANGSATSLGLVPGHTTLRSAAYNISDAGQAVGYARFADLGDRAVRWDASGLATLLGVAPGQDGYSLANGINNAGQAVGEAHFASVGNPLAVRWAADASAKRLGDLPGHVTGLSQAWGITDGGLVGGYAYLEDLGDFGANRAVLWDADGTPSMLQDLMADGNAWTFTSIEGLDANAGTLRALAIGSKNGGPFNYYLVEASVPEPATLSLLAIAASLRRLHRLSRIAPS